MTVKSRLLPLYSRLPKSIRSSVESFERFWTFAFAPLAPLISTFVAPGWTARNAWSKKNRRAFVSFVLLRAVTSIATWTRLRDGWTV